MHGIKILLIIIGLAELFLFCIPLFYKGMLNIGNTTGMILSLLLIGYGFCFERINSLIHDIWMSHIGKMILCFLGVLCCIVLTITIIFTYLMFNHAYKQPVKNTTVVILGGRVYEDRPSLMLKERLDVAYDYLKNHLQVSCIVSGGQGDNEPISEAKCMFDYLVKKGIDKKRIYLEDQSTSTRENLLFSQKIIEKYQLASSITIITSEFHQYRAQFIAKKLNLEAYSISSQTSWWLFPTFYVRELLGLFYQLII